MTTQTNPLTLLPCPFCGGPARIHCYGADHEAMCQDCQATGETTLTEAAAVAAWNRRAALPASEVGEKRSACFCRELCEADCDMKSNDPCRHDDTARKIMERAKRLGLFLELDAEPLAEVRTPLIGWEGERPPADPDDQPGQRARDASLAPGARDHG